MLDYSKYNDFNEIIQDKEAREELKKKSVEEGTYSMLRSQFPTFMNLLENTIYKKSKNGKPPLSIDCSWSLTSGFPRQHCVTITHNENPKMRMELFIQQSGDVFSLMNARVHKPDLYFIMTDGVELEEVEKELIEGVLKIMGCEV